MSELSLIETGPFHYDEDEDEHRSPPLTVPMLGRSDVEIIVVGYADDPAPQDFHVAIRNLLAQTPETLLAASLHLHRYCLDMGQFAEPGERIRVDRPDDLWDHVQFGKEVYVSRRYGGDREVYASIESGCDWEPEHGLQIVLRQGIAVTKLGPFDGHLSNADAFGDDRLESLVYRPIG